MIELASKGHTNRQIGFLLGYSEKTVRNRFTPIFRKLGAANRVEAIRKAEAYGLLGTDKG
jgi:two-component system response regulator DegU